jgi:phosphatidylglycerophosphatase A
MNCWVFGYSFKIGSGMQSLEIGIGYSKIRNMKMSRFFLLFATGFGVGYSPIAPGTLGTLITIPLYYFLSAIRSPLYEITLIAFIFLSIWISENAETFFGKKDDPRIVIDEMIGFLIAMLWVPKTTCFIIIGFFLFRFFDILKPFPIRRLERRLKGGFGVVLDDVMAGVYANIVLQLIDLVARQVYQGSVI